MEPRNTRPISTKKSAPALDKEFRFQPEPEKSNNGNGSLILGPVENN